MQTSNMQICISNVNNGNVFLSLFLLLIFLIRANETEKRNNDEENFLWRLLLFSSYQFVSALFFMHTSDFLFITHTLHLNNHNFYSFQVLDERVYHIEYAPEQPEPYYKATGKELQPRPVGEEHGIIVYNYMPISAVHYVSL